MVTGWLGALARTRAALAPCQRQRRLRVGRSAASHGGCRQVNRRPRGNVASRSL